jgi:hypothetical protein
MAFTADTREVLGNATLGELEGALRGRLVRPTDPDYDQARLVWNAAHDRHPALIIRCAGVSDVVRAVEFARSEGLQVAVRGGAHSIAGCSTSDGGDRYRHLADEGHPGGSRRPAGCRPARAHLIGARRRDAGIRAGRHRGPGVEHRHHRLHPRRRDRWAGCVQRAVASVGSGRSGGHMASASSLNAVASRSGGETSMASS